MIEVVDQGRLLEFSFEDLMRYHGPGSPGGVAHAFKVLELALPLLGPDGPCERREIVVGTAFGGPGARDAFELVTRAVTGDRFRVDPGLARPERGRTRERFVFRLGYRDTDVTLALREGFVTEEFVDLARTDERNADQERRLDVLKVEMAERVLAPPAGEVYEVS
ncbi:MAG: hypothetical protein QOK00_873 [Thermoleophilaceae bacterium]|nr:hypothetical protein [Thermoleophilaceae bacterium]